MDPPGPFAQLLDRRDKEIELWRRRSVEWDAERAHGCIPKNLQVKKPNHPRIR